MTVEIVAYSSFSQDWLKLPPNARKALALIFARLKNNPYDPDLVGAAELFGDDQFAIELPEGFAVYWGLRSTPKLPDISLERASIKIMLTGVRSLR